MDDDQEETLDPFFVALHKASILKGRVIRLQERIEKFNPKYRKNAYAVGSRLYWLERELFEARMAHGDAVSAAIAIDPHRALRANRETAQRLARRRLQAMKDLPPAIFRGEMPHGR